MKIEILPFNQSEIVKLETRLITNPEGSEELGSDLRLFRYIIWQLNLLGCKHIVVEEDYLDRDFTEDYSTYYSGTFIDQGKQCDRLHFFGSYNSTTQLPFGTNKNTENLKENLSSIQDVYYGFMVILPTLRNVIGRTVIKPGCNKDDSSKREHYCTTQAEIKVNLEGVPLKIFSAPFIQQSAPVGVCSSTAIWIAARILKLRYDFPRYSLSSITKAANKFIRINRTFPATRGLTIEQIISGLIELGFNPLVYQKRTFPEPDLWDPKEIIYKYMESGLPVIVIVGGIHACVVIGHDFNPDKKIKTNDNLVSNSVFIESYIVHDDAMGPYLLMSDTPKVSAGAYKYEIDRKFDPFSDKPNIHTPYSMSQISCIIIPSFKKVYLEGQEIEDMIHHIFESEKSMFRYWYKDSINKYAENELSGETLKKAKLFLKVLEKNKGKIFYRTRFLLSNDLKEDYLIRKNHVPLEVAEIYSQLSLPRYVWLVELSLEDDIRQSMRSDENSARQILGEIIIDATSIEDPIAIAAVHFPGYIITNALYDEVGEEFSNRVYTVNADHIYESFDRSRLVNYE